MSFARAAEELHVTPQALSLQIKSLEEHLGTPVFRRLGRAVELTEAGRALVPGAQSGFEALSRGWAAARRASDPSRLTVTAGPAFTAKWLAPRLPDFARAHPNIELRFSAGLRLMSFESDEIDIAIRFGETAEPGLFSRDLIREWIAPMMSPALAEMHPTLDTLADAPLIHQEIFPFSPERLDWAHYFASAGLGSASRQGARFSHADHAVDAAIAGAGAVLGRWSVAQGDLARGALVAPYPLAIRLPHRYRLLCPKGDESRPQVAAFISWIEAQVAAMPSLDEQFTFIEMEDLP